MTVAYSEGKYSGIMHPFFRWKGSVYKLVWRDLIIFLVLYTVCNALYRFVLDADQRLYFEKIVIYCEKYGSLIPVSFILGFYVSLVIGRWWAQYKTIPWIDSLAIWVNVSIKNNGEIDRLFRRTICRYVCLSITQCFTLISSQVKKRFPTLDHLIAAGLLLENEKATMLNVVSGISKYQTHWIPLVWATNLVSQARAEGRISGDASLKAIIDEINFIKNKCNQLLCFDRIRVPLVYTQVATLAVYAYFLSALMGRQSIKRAKDTSATSENDEYERIVPVFTILQFLFYHGWLKVAESLVNPFGEDDYDFELNWMVDRHLQVSYSIVDKMHFQNPKMYKDPYWDEVVPHELPHTIASVKYNNAPPVTSTATVVVTNGESEILSPSNQLSISTIAKTDIRFKTPILSSVKNLIKTTIQMEIMPENENTNENANPILKPKRNDDIFRIPGNPNV